MKQLFAALLILVSAPSALAVQTYKIGFSYRAKDGATRAGVAVVAAGKSTTLTLPHATLKLTPAPYHKGSVKIDLEIRTAGPQTKTPKRTTVITGLNMPAELVEEEFTISLKPSV